MILFHDRRVLAPLKERLPRYAQSKVLFETTFNISPEYERGCERTHRTESTAVTATRLEPDEIEALMAHLLCRVDVTRGLKLITLLNVCWVLQD